MLVDQGGIENARTAQKQIAQHAALLGLSIEDAACKIIEGEGAEIDMTSFMALINCQRRCLEALGLDRKAARHHADLAQVIAEIEDKKADRAQAVDADRGHRMTQTFNIEDALGSDKLLGAALAEIETWSVGSRVSRRPSPSS